MRVLYYNNGSGLGTAKSGGTARHIETARRLIEKGVEVHVVTTEGAYSIYNKENLLPKSFTIVRAHLSQKKETNNFDRAMSYVISTMHSSLKVFSLPNVDIVYSTSDYFCDVIPALVYKIFRRRLWVIMIHHLCKSPFERKGNFLINLVSYISQRANYLFVRYFANNVLVYDTPEGEKIARMIFGENYSNKVSFVFNGLDYTLVNSMPNEKKIYDACFAGGLRVTKGIYDIIPVWKKVCEHIPDALLVIAGGGTPTIEKDLKQKISEAGLEENIRLVGALSQKELYSTFRKSKVFISLSHEEGWGIAINEAMASELPVVAFELPAFRYLQDTIITVPKFNHSEFAKRTIELLNNSDSRLKKGIEGKIFIQKFDWSKISDTEFLIFSELLV